MFDGGLIIVGQENGRGRSVGLGDNPEFDAVAVHIRRKESASIFEGLLVGVFVLVAKVAPIALAVAIESRNHAFLRNLRDCGAREQKSPERDFCLRLPFDWCLVHVISINW